MSDPASERPVEGLRDHEPRRRGCLFWGCMGLLVVLVLVVLCIGGCAFYFSRIIKQITSTEPQDIPEYRLQPGEYERIERRLDEFRRAAEQDQPAELVLAADDLNALLAGHPDLQEIPGKKFVRIEGDQILVDASIPTDELPVVSTLAPGRYLNATLGVKPALVNRRLLLFIDSITVNGKPAPEEFMRGLRRKDILQDVRDDRLSRFLETARSLEVRDGKLFLKR